MAARSRHYLVKEGRCGCGRVPRSIFIFHTLPRILFIAHESTHFHLQPHFEHTSFCHTVCTRLNLGTAVMCFYVFFGTQGMDHCSSDVASSVVNSGKVVFRYDNMLSDFVLHLLCE
ncbi:hypothetical protein AVEN_120147-1 [Araneus ventricosus]|uniref:Uncharacterized protein n=1 Tax=Araneus ventricosus TaxID=182803 RepID=A0A4Y2AQT4_ARAVE|nr:hypothetical protein AVEN_27671-1 [Araneus ventricosus]GBL82114.1 hypothetical protein AVEN_191215-1 [Araneus ventricosus]GBL82142.1 hypothetical protein AVEN_256760-1 [Araneus ventricosus]GBL82291.1 hypothetical protein AVEN_120147-1 [Araneus ventricosus]